MAQTSVGFNGTINELEWANMAPYLGHDDVGNTAATAGVTQVAGFRRVLVPAGVFAGWGVQTTLSTAESPAADMPAPAAGQWHLLVLRRVWATKATSLVTVPHSTTTNVTQTVVPSTFPAAMLATPGVQDDVPIAWLWVNVTTTNVAIWPILKKTNSVRITALEVPVGPLAMAAGFTVPRVVQPGIAGISTTVVTFPVGRFTQPPVVTAVNSRSAPSGVDPAGFITVSACTATQVTLLHVVSGGGAQILGAGWIAVQMTSASAPG